MLVSRERDSYRLQLDSYEKDLTMCVNTSVNGGSNLIQSQKDRIDNLEKIVEGYRDMVSKLENDLQNLQPDLHNGKFTIYFFKVTRNQRKCVSVVGSIF